MCIVKKKNKQGALLPVVVICAPTACGKTDLAYRLFSTSCNSFLSEKAEIISADSMQVYRYMDIGTAKPDKDLQAILPHHLIDICDPAYQFGVGDFVRHAKELVIDIISRKKLPVILGGTAFYIKNFVYGLPTTPRVDDSIRIAIEKRMENEGPEKLWNELKKLDPISAEKIHINDIYRIKRALEVCHATGKPRSSFLLPQKSVEGYNFLIINLERPRQELYERVEKRIDCMFEMGLETEVENLKKMGYTQDSPGMQAIGYREFFVGETIAEVKALITKSTKEYVKRQQTFFKTFDNAIAISPDNFDIIEKKIYDFYSNSDVGT